jgi:hypothetical protein
MTEELSHATDSSDESEKQEFLRCTCLDRARIALEQTGQHHCAGVMRELQEVIDDICITLEHTEGIILDPNKPVAVLQELADFAEMGW